MQVMTPIDTMRLTNIKVKNFKCFKDLNLDFSIEKGLFLITGQNLENPALGTNGLGKTSLFDAICWCLYGKTSKGTKAGKLMNRNAKGGYSVVLNFNGKQLERTWTPNGLRLDNQEVPQDKIDELVGLSYEQFLYSIYFGQQADHFIDLTSNEKLTFLSNLFELDKWVECSEVCKTKLATLNHSLHGEQITKEHNLKSIEQSLQHLVNLEEEQSAWANVHETSIKELTLQIENFNKEIVPVEDQDMTDLDLNIKETMNDIQHLTTNEIQQAETKERELYGQQMDLESQAVRLKKQINDLDRKANTECPSCFQNVPQEHLNSIKESLSADLTSLATKIQKVTSDRKSWKGILSESLHKQDLLKEMLDMYKVALAGIKERALSNVKQLNALEILHDALRAKNDEVNPYDTQIEYVQLKLVDHNEYLDKCDETINRLEKQQSGYAFWQKRFPQIRLEILNEVIEELEIHFNQAFSYMGLLDWQIKLSTERELKNESIKNELTLKLFQNDKEIDIDGLSGGERQRLRIVTALGISDLIKARLGVSWNLLLLDEPSANLSAEGIDNMLNMLSMLGETNLIFLADHRMLDMGKFDGMLNLVKNIDGNSEVTLKV